MRLNQLRNQMPPLRAPILTKMVVSASMASVLMRCCSSHNRSTGGLLIRTTCMRRVHHMRGGADDVTGLLIAALTASTHANRPWQRSPAALAMRCSGSGSGANGAARWSTQRLWFGCKPLGYRQDGLEMRLNQPQDRMPPLRAPIQTKMVVSASVR